ncbi:MAG: 3-phosphoserine/phosphohydroxythreonine transaminase [Woeseiaceae bacterium]
MGRVYNFSAGPAVLPDAVLQQIRDDIPDWHGGMSVMEVSHRSKEFLQVAEKAEQDVRDLLGVPADYSVLFVQGGATLQFAMVPLNLAAPGDAADYINTGTWSKKALAEARRFCRVNVAADAEGARYCNIPDTADWHRSADASYLHYTANETIGGVEFHFIPETGDVPLVSDMSSTLLSRPLDVSRYTVIYAGAQKNIGPAGITLVIVRKDMLTRVRDDVPTLLKYATYAESGSMSNTPPTFAWYVAGLVFAHLLQQGGLTAIEAINERKAQKLYTAIDASEFYSNPVDKGCRSWMNVPFVLADPALDAKFLGEADAAGLRNLRGHRSVGGMRASIYNAMPETGVDTLIEFMQEFERTNG